MGPFSDSKAVRFLVALNCVLIVAIVLSIAATRLAMSEDPPLIAQLPVAPLSTLAVVQPVENPVANPIENRTVRTAPAKVEQKAAKEPAKVIGPPADSPLARGRVTTSVAVEGQPFGVGKLEIAFGEKDAPHWKPDHSILLMETKRRTRYPAYLVREFTGRFQQLSVYFLFQGSDPLNLEVHVAGSAVVRGLRVRPQANPAQHASVLKEWWNQYTDSLGSVDGEERELKQFLSEMLARRLSLPGAAPKPSASGESPMADLERQFERMVGTLLGFDSVILAMPDSVSMDAGRWGAADQNLPRSFRMASVRLPRTPGNVPIEPLAFRTPQDCFYVRCRSLENYLWLRGFMLQWGGSLYEIVAKRTTDLESRAVIERQLALQPGDLQKQRIDQFIDDFALIGTDLFFGDGAGVGVLLQASDNDAVSKMIESQRKEAIRNGRDVVEQTLHVDGRAVSYLSSEGNVVRSFYVHDGRFHLVTNCETIMRNFVRLKHGGGLGRLAEFRYARSRQPLSDPARVWMYLSDPFFRRLVSPQFRIEMGRRALALAELKKLRIARYAARSEGRSDDLTSLKQDGFLASTFARRPDRSSIMIQNGVALDTLRGRPGTFLPIADVSVGRATRGEVNDYEIFRRRYSRQWRAMDPVIVSMNHQSLNQAERSGVSIKILVTPYARQRYQSLRSLLVDKPQNEIPMLRDDLLSLSATLKEGGKHHPIHVGLLDEKVPFRIEDGKIQRQAPFDRRTFAGRNFYASSRSSRFRGLQLLQQFVQSVEGDRNDSPPAVARTATPRQIANQQSTISNLLGSVTPKGLLLTAIREIPRLSLKSHMLNNIKLAEGWAIMGKEQSIRQKLTQELRLEASVDQTQVRFQMADVGASQVAPYLHAYTWLESRKASARNAQLFEVFRDQFGLPSEQSRSAAEEVFNVRFVCPLGGDYKLVDAKEGSKVWKSSSWKTDSYADVKNAPPEYRFPFLDWLHGMKVAFNLSTTTLSADIQLVVKDMGPPPTSLQPEIASRPRKSRQAPRTAPQLASFRPEDVSPGDDVLIKGDGVKLRLAAQLIATLRRNERVRVLEIRDQWIGVQTERRDRAVRGWIHIDQVGGVRRRAN